MRIPSRLNRLFPYLAIVALFLFTLLRIFIINSKTADLAGIEQNVIYSIQVLMDTGKLYFSPSTPPFSITQYSPLYYYLCSFSGKLIGYGPNDIHALYIIGRTWSLVFNLITAIIIYWTASSLLKLSRNHSYLAGILSFTFAFAHNYAARPDSMQDMLGIASICVFILFLQRKASRKSNFFYLFSAILLTVFATFSKQGGFQFIIIFSGFFMLNRDWGSLIKMIFISIILYGSFLFGFKLIYPSFFENIIGGVSNGISIDNFIHFVIAKKIFIMSVWPLIICTMYLIFKDNGIFKGNTINRFLALAALGTLIFATATALKMGSTTQYYIIFINLSFLIIIAYLEAHQRNSKERSVKTINFSSLTYLFFFLVILLYALQNGKLIMNFDYNLHLEKQRSAAIQTVEFIKANKRKDSNTYIFSNITTDHTIPSRQSINNIFYKECLLPQMDILEYSTNPSKVIDYSRLKEILESGSVDFIIESQPKSKFKILNDIDSIRSSKYTLVKEIDGYLIYKFSH